MEDNLSVSATQQSEPEITAETRAEIYIEVSKLISEMALRAFEAGQSNVIIGTIEVIADDIRGRADEFLKKE